MSNIIKSTDRLLELPVERRRYLTVVRSQVEADAIREAESGVTARLVESVRDLAENPWSSLIPVLGTVKMIHKLVSDPPPSQLVLVSANVGKDLSLAAKPMTVYARHPLLDRRYFELSRYHADVKDDRMLELERLLVHLGAKTLTISTDEGDAWNGEAGVSGKHGKETCGIKGTARSKQESFASISSSFAAPKAPPSIPDGLAWYHMEPTWQQMAALRISHGRLDYSLELKLTNDYGITADVAAAMADCKLNIGGKFNGLVRRHFKATVEFWPLDSES